MSSNKHFGILFSIVFAVVGLFPFVDGMDLGSYIEAGVTSLHHWSLITALVFLGLAYFAPNSLTVPNRLWFELGITLSKIFTPAIMAIVFCIAVIPTGLIIRLAGKDLINIKLQKRDSSYWIKRDLPLGSMKNQF